MHEELNNKLETKWLQKIDGSLSEQGIKVRREKDDDGKWVFTCTCDKSQAEKARKIFEKEGADCVDTEKGVECTARMPRPVFCTYAPENEEKIREEKIRTAKSAVEALPNAVYEDTGDGLTIAVLPPYVPNKAGNIAKFRDYQHRTAEALAAGYDLSDIFKYMLIDSPTGSGKSTMLTLLYLVLKEKDPELKMIISTTQHSLVRNILDSFRAMEGVRAVAFKGVEKLVEEFFDEKDGDFETKYQKVVREGMELLDQMSGRRSEKHAQDQKKCEQIKKETEDKKTEYEQLIRDIRNKWNIIRSRYGADGSEKDGQTEKRKVRNLTEAEKEEREEKVKALSASYKQAEKLLNDICMEISKEEAEDAYHVLKKKTPSLGKKEKKGIKRDLINRFYTEKMELIDRQHSTLLLLFPDLQYELSDVVVVTHAKSVRSILNKRSLDLSNISYEAEGRHIVFVVDEMEQWRDECEGTSIKEAVKSSMDMLLFVNTIHSTVEKGYFSNRNYEIVSDDGKRENKAAKTAEKIKDYIDKTFKDIQYVPNMHMADFTDGDFEHRPRITSCGTYLIQNVPKDLEVEMRPGTMEVAVVRHSKKSPKIEDQPLVKEKKTTGFTEFVQKMDRIPQMFVGAIREAANGLNQLHNKGIQTEDYETTIGTVLHQLAIEPGAGGRAEFIRRNLFPRHGVRWVSREKQHPYQLGISYTVLRPRLSSGRDVYLNYLKVDKFADAAMADINYNVKFTYLLSGTGWISGQNNLDDGFLNEETGKFLPDRTITEEIHDEYMKWKSAQYRDTKFIVERVVGEELTAFAKDREADQNRYRMERLDTCAVFIARHMRYMEGKGVDGGTGGLIFPSWAARPDDVSFLRTRIRKYGGDPDNVILLSLERGEIKEWYTDSGQLKQRPYAGAGVSDDTQVIRTVKGKYTYVITAYRSGTRGYNIAFTKEGDEALYDASGIWLTAFTNIIPGINEENSGKYLETDTDYRNRIARLLEINAKIIHSIILREGTISRQAMAGVEGRIRQLLGGANAAKDIYKEDIWSPYKLQGTSEILQALGRLRNNKKEPVIYIALDTIIFGKLFLREEHLDPDRLSYEAAQVYDRLPALWENYESEFRSSTFTDEKTEKAIVKKSEKIIRVMIPNMKKELAGSLPSHKRDETLRALAVKVHDYEYVKRRAMFMNTVLYPYPYHRESGDNKNVGIPSIWLSSLDGRDIPPFTYYSRKIQDGTEFSANRFPGLQYISPSTGDIVPVIRMFSHVCRDALKKRIPELMNPDTLRLMDQKDMFPYPVFANAFGYDLFIGEFGEVLFDAMMEWAHEAGMTNLIVRPMPVTQYEDFDKEISEHGALKGYVNVKYRIDSDFELEKDPKYYVEKVMRSPMAGEIPLLYIDIRPFGDERTNKVFTGKAGEGILSDVVRKANKTLESAGKSIVVISMKPLTKNDMYAAPARIKEVINEQIIYQFNRYFGG